MSICGLPNPVLTEADRAAYDRGEWGMCCLGAGMRGPDGCTCWKPVYDLDQAEPRTDLTPTTNAKPCGDCAYRPDSPEYKADPWALVDLPSFWCHRGMRRPRVWRHPELGERPGDPADYQPPIIGDTPYRADGRPAARCGGHEHFLETMLAGL